MREGWIVAEGKIELGYDYAECTSHPAHRVGNQLISDVIAKVEREYGNQPIQIIVKAVRPKTITLRDMKITNIEMITKDNLINDNCIIK